MMGQILATAQTQPPTREAAERLVLETARHVERLTELSRKFPKPFKAVASRKPVISIHEERAASLAPESN